MFLWATTKIDWKELAKIVVVMALGIFGAVFIKGLFVGKEHLLYKLLGLLVIGFRYRLYKLLRKPEDKPQNTEEQGSGKAALALTHCWCLQASSTGCSSAAARCSQVT